MCDINRWTIFSLLSPEFVDEIKLAVVFGSSGNEALLVTRRDDVYGVGTNACGCLGIGNGQSCLEPTKVEPLSNAQVVALFYGSGPHVVALTASGMLFVWGHNGYGQLGTGNTVQTACPVRLAASVFGGASVVRVSCGNHHTAVVTDRGDLYAWGQNSAGQIGTGNNVNQPTPRKVGGSLNNRFVRVVACGQNCTMAVTTSGELFSWGLNANGQLGVGNISNQLSPSRVMELQNFVISQVVCGFAHTMALTDEGELFAWGSNSCGQLASASKSNLPTPGKTAADLGRITEVAATQACNLSAVLTQTNQVFMWGQVRGQTVSSPQRTRFSRVDDVFASFATPTVCWRNISFACPVRDTVQETVMAAFDDAATCDLKIKVDGRILHVHSSILKIRCQYFRSMLKDHWVDAKSDVELDQYSYSVYRAFLYYLYTDVVDSDSLTEEELLSLLDLANSYCEQGLKNKCAELVRRAISVDNALLLYASALRLEVHDLELYCFQFCMNHTTAVIETEAFQKLDGQSVKHFILEAAKHGAFKH